MFALFCPDCGAESALATHCTECGSPLPGPLAPTAPDGWQLWQLKPLGRWAAAVYVLLGIAMTASAVSAVAYLRAGAVLDDVAEGNAVPLTSDALRRLDAAGGFMDASSVVAGVTTALAGLVFIAWFHRARQNVAWLGLHQPSLGPGWAIGGWFCPVVNLWFPARIAHDLWKGSDTSRGARYSDGLLGRTVLITCWWVAFAAAVVLDRLVGRFWSVDELVDGFAVFSGVDGLVLWSKVAASSGLLMVVAGAFAIPFVHRVTVLQAERARELWVLSGSPERWRTSPAASAAAPRPRSPWAEVPRA
ncbi:DUF4328 domain-containing protein [Streptomycetaceae bacterium NBC_01309]